jgi:hypothetical protein
VKAEDRTRKRAFISVMALLVAALFIVAAKTAYDYGNAPLTDALADAKVEQYFAEHPGPFCVLEGVWHDWERDETMTLGCLEIKGHCNFYVRVRKSRATRNFSATKAGSLGRTVQ